MSDNVIPFGGITYADIPPKHVLEKALDADLESAFVIGMLENGEFYAAGSTGDLGYTLICLERFKKLLLAGIGL